MNLTLITINFNNARATVDLLRALEQQTTRNFDVIVVDNDSTADDRSLLGSYGASSALRLDIIYSDRNRGFSGGNNLAIRKALAQESEWVLLINNDTTVGPDFVATLARQLPRDPCIAGLPLDEGERIAHAGMVQWLRPTLGHVYERTNPESTDDTLLYAVGAGMLVHREVFERIGLLDENYFLYFEDTDFTLRACRANIAVKFLDEPVISHRPSETTSKLGRPLLLRYHARNALRLNWRQGPWWVRTAVPLAVCYGIALQTAKLALGRHSDESRAIRSGIVDAVVSRWGRIATEPVIAVECESLEDASWGVARMIRGFLSELEKRDDLKGRLLFDLYFKSRIPDEPWLKNPLFRTHIVRSPSWLPVPVSFSLYYYLLLPLRLWRDRPSLTYWPNYMLPIIAPQPSLVMLTEDIWHQIHNPHLALRYRAAYAIFARWAAHTATRIMAISNASKENLHRFFGITAERVVVNELGVDAAQKIAPMPGSYVLFVGQAFERRHLRETIQAFREIASDNPDLRFVAIGPDKYEPPIISELVRRTNEHLGRPAVQHIERVSDEDLKRFYGGAHTIVYISEIEAFGLPPLEALSYGVPALVADTALTREIYGEHAFYTSSYDSAAIATALKRTLDDGPARQRIKDGAHSVIARYTWKAHAGRMLNIIDDIVRTS